MDGRGLTLSHDITVLGARPQLHHQVLTRAVVGCTNVLFCTHIVVVAVAGEAPPHAHFNPLGDLLVHLLNGSVTGLAGHPRRNMSLVGKKDMLGKMVHLDPVKGATLSKQFLDALGVGAVAGHLLVATITQAGRWHGGVPGFVGVEVAIETVHLVVPGMDLVAEGDGLFRCVAQIL